jgi:hypothetical protein
LRPGLGRVTRTARHTVSSVTPLPFTRSQVTATWQLVAIGIKWLLLVVCGWELLGVAKHLRSVIGSTTAPDAGLDARRLPCPTVEVALSTRTLLTRGGAMLVVAALAAGLAPAGPVQAASAPASDSASAAPADLPVGKPRQIVNRVQNKLCLTFAVTPDGIPTAVMIKCNKGSKGKIQQWTYTADQQLMVSMSKGVGGDLPNGACLDTAADLTTVQDKAPLLVLPCRAGAGQKWTYNKDTGTLINQANGKALSSMIGVAKQAMPTSTVVPNGGKDQKWRDAGIPMETLIGAIAQLLDALLEALGLEMPDEYETRGLEMLKSIDGKVQVPDQLKQLPKKMVEMAG